MQISKFIIQVIIFLSVRNVFEQEEFSYIAHHCVQICNIYKWRTVSIEKHSHCKSVSCWTFELLNSNDKLWDIFGVYTVTICQDVLFMKGCNKRDQIFQEMPQFSTQANKRMLLVVLVPWLLSPISGDKWNLKRKRMVVQPSILQRKLGIYDGRMKRRNTFSKTCSPAIQT